MPQPVDPGHPANESPEARAARPGPNRAGSSAADEPTRVSSRTPQPAPPDLEGARIEGYRLLEELHRGGQGVVYRAIQLGTKRQVALKVLLEGPFASRSSRRRFEREIELAASLRHPNVVTILDSGISHGRYYFAMEYINGQRLDRYLAKHRPSLKDTLSLFATIAGAVNFAHQRGVIHRDLKPPNILVDEGGEPHVLDFGLAKPTTAADGDQTTLQVLSSAGELLGTVAYMSPEQTVGSLDVDVRSDVYSLGVVFYEALLGQLPYSVEGPLGEVLTRIANAEPVPPRTVRGSSRFGRLVDDELETILLKALEKHPIRRYQTAGDLGRDLQRLLEGQPIEAKRASGLYMLRKTLRRYRLQATAAATVLAMMVVFLVAFAFLWRSEREARGRASQHQTEALQRAMELGQARDAAVRAQEDLQQALVRQTIQRGELAQTRGDLVAARDSYWEAWEDSGSPAALWALRQYYLQTGDDGASVLYFESHGPDALSPDGRLAAVCETAEAITIRQVASGRAVGWLRMPGRASALSVDDRGTVCAAGAGWARLWHPESMVPALAAELPADFQVASVHAVSQGQRLLAAGPERLLCFEGSDGTVVGATELLASATGNADCSPQFDRLAVPTETEVQMIVIGPRGQLRSERVGPLDVTPLAVRFAGDELVALTPDAVYRTPVARAGLQRWRRFKIVPREWRLFDVCRATGSLVLAAPDGRVELFREGQLDRTWRIAVGDLKDLRLIADGKAVLTVDQRGTVTRWVPAYRKQEDRRIYPRPPVAWAVAEDGSTVLMADERQRVVAYTPQRSPRPETIVARRPFSLLSPITEEVHLAVSSAGARAVICIGNAIRLRDARAGGGYAATWSDPNVALLEHAAITGDGEVIALCAQTATGDRHRISFWSWQPRVQTERSLPLPDLLPPARPAVEFDGGGVRHMAFVPGRAELVVARSNGDLLRLQADRGNDGPPAPDRLQATPPPKPWVRLDSPPVAVAFDRAGKQLAVACEDGFLRLLAATDGSLRARIRLSRPVKAVAFNPPGEVLMVRSEDGTVSLYALEAVERVALLAFPSDPQYALAAWIGDGDTMLLGFADGVEEHAYHDTDDLIAKNRSYARQRAVARHLADGDLAVAWKRAAALGEFDAGLARSAQETILEAALRRPGEEIPTGWTAAVLNGAPLHTLIRLGHAAYDGERFQLAGRWLRQGSKQLQGKVDAHTALRSAQCDYLAGSYDQAAARFDRLLDRPDLDAACVPTAQLQQAAALVLAHRQEEARQVARRIGSLRRDSLRSDIVAATSARDIARYLTGLESESLWAASFERFLGRADASLLFHDDWPFFNGELARRRGDQQEAQAQYQRCIDLARDLWPANWARYRLLQLSRAAQ